ncbi:MAG TPA: alpha/beta hydrolase [Chitinophagaceae bacterium]|nr:alpha/beta hydrolase [Chitinophagaceae bacterium]
MKKLIIVLVLVTLAVSIRPFAQNINRIISKQIFEITHLTPQPVVKTINLPGRVRLEYAEQGNADGIPVIFLHGITDSWHSFESVLANLSSSIHAFAISQRGHGDSERPLQNYTPKDFAADIAEFIKQKNLNSAFIVGHSMGGVNAQQFAIDYPELTRGLVIIDSDPAMKSNPGMPEFYQEVLKLEGAIDRKFMDDFQRATLADPIDSTYYNLLVNEGIKVPSSVFKAALEGLMEVDLTEQLKQINTPAVIFWGNQDAFCTFTGQEILINNIKNSRLIVYGNTGHALHWEEPKKFSEDLVNFIDNVIGL